MEVAAIIPTRGVSRKVFTHWQVQRAHDMGYVKVYLIDHEPTGHAMDLGIRIQEGVLKAVQDGIEAVSVIEDDDFYSLEYLNQIAPLLEQYEIVGINRTIYYHLFHNGRKTMVHPGRSSMFCTSFRTEAFPKLPVQTLNGYLDLAWWNVANMKRMNLKLIDKDLAIGIKHGGVFGPTGGNGHTMRYNEIDRNMDWFRQRVDAEAFAFYKELKDTFINQWRQHESTDSRFRKA